MKFKYRAIGKNGEEQSGQIEADNRQKAVEILQKYDFTLVSVDSADKLFSVSGIIGKFRKGVGAKKLVMFSKELSILISSGVSLVEALRIQYEQEDDKYFKEQISTMADMIDDGHSLSSALSRFPDTFSDFYINIVRSGEVSGKMQDSLMHLAEYVEKRYLLTSKVRNAMLYPCVIMFAFLGVGVAMMVLVIPQLVSIFRENDMELPITTRIVIAVSDFLVNNFMLFIVMLIILIFGGRRYVKTESGKENMDRLFLTMPPFKDLFKKYYLARFADNLSMLIGSGVNIVRALEISGDVAGNAIYTKLIYESVEDVKVGGSIAYAFENNKYVPPMISKMISIGERTGKIDSVLKDVADFYTKEVDIAVDGVSAIIEPILILILGCGVGVLVSAIILPIYQMTEII
jgi:type IV pilus assembly protein PilC